MNDEQKTKKQLIEELEALRKREEHHRQVEAELRKSEERYKAIIENVEDGYYEIDLAGNLTFFNKALENLSGFTGEELKGINNRHYTSSETAKRMYMVYNEIYRTGNASKISDYEIIRKDGTRKSFEVSASLMTDTEGRKVGFRGFARDITTHRQAEELYRTLAEKSFAGVYVVKEGIFRFINTKGASYAGYSPEEMIGRRSDFILHPEEREEVKNKGREMLHGKRAAPYEFRIVTKDGRVVWIMETVTPIYYEGGPAVLGNSMEVSERKQYEEEIRAISVTDQLTGLYNRRGFLTFAEQQLKIAERTKSGLTLLFADLDDMKWVNDTLGHKKGDEALVEAADVLREVFRGSDIIARIGGDEFAVLALGAARENPDVLTERLSQRLDAHNAKENRKYHISMSIGVAYQDPENPCTLDELMSKADALMYEGKKQKCRSAKPP